MVHHTFTGEPEFPDNDGGNDEFSSDGDGHKLQRVRRHFKQLRSKWRLFRCFVGNDSMPACDSFKCGRKMHARGDVFADDNRNDHGGRDCQS